MTASVSGLNANEQLDSYTVNGDTLTPAMDGTITFIVDADTTVTANISQVVDTFTVTTSVDGSTTASVNLAPSNSPGQPAGTFVGGTEVVANVVNLGPTEEVQDYTVNGDVTPAAPDGTLTFTVNEDITLVARITLSGAPDIATIEPAEAFIFGGVVSRVTGTNFVPGFTVTLDGQPLTPFNITSNSFDITIPVNEGDGNPATASFDVDLTVTNPNEESDTEPFTYVRFETEDGVTTTALLFGNSTTDPAELPFQLGDGTSGTLDLPALESMGGGSDVFGLVRNTTSAMGVLATDTIPGGSTLPGIIDFALHLYTQPEVKQTTPPGPAQLLADASDALFDFGTPIDPETGQPVASSPALISFPVPEGSGLTAGTVRDNVRLFGVGTTYNFVSDTTTLALGTGGDIDFNTKQLQPVVNYQSTLVADEAMFTGGTGIVDLTTPSDDTAATMVMEARLYDTNAYSLRIGAPLPMAVTDGGRLEETSGTLIVDSLDAGVALNVVSPRGGLGFIDRVEFRLTGSETIVGSIQGADIRIPTGDTGEFTLPLTTPEITEAGITDLLVFLEGDTQTPAFTLERVVEFRAADDGMGGNLLLLLLGVLVAIIGLAAGGVSDDDGGGPCFIATAAYGTPLDEDITALRSVRDEYMLGSVLGTAATDAYYSVSPAVADAVAANPWLAALVRVLLVPVVAISKLLLVSPLLTGLLLATATALWYGRRRRSAAA